jgi:hypothetical protein
MGPAGRAGTRAPSPWDNPAFSGIPEPPPPGVIGLPRELPTPTPTPTQFEPRELKVTPHDIVPHTPPASGNYHPPSFAVGRGGVGIIGLVGGGIAALFRALFGRRKEE